MKTAKKPEIEVTPNVFKITFPNVNAAAVSENFSVNTPAQEECNLQLAKEKGVISRKDVEMLLDVSQTFAGQILRKMSENNC